MLKYMMLTLVFMLMEVRLSKSNKLKFYYGTISSGKSLEILRTYYLNRDSKKIALVKPSVDTRNIGVIYTRFGDQTKECITWNENETLSQILGETKYDMILIDECQFLNDKQLNEINDLYLEFDVDINLYGLLRDYQQNIFRASMVILGMCDSIIEMTSKCHTCGEDAKQSARIENGKVVYEGNLISVGFNYVPLCNYCYLNGVLK